MIRNLKALGLAFAAMLVMGAVAASGASAQQFQGELTTEDGQEVTLNAKENPAPAVNALTAFDNGIRCPESTYTGHKVLNHEQTTHIEATEEKEHGEELVSNGSTEITLSPHYNQAACEDEFDREATVDMNSCDYDLRIGTTTGSNNTFGLGATITCDEPGDEIHVGIWAKGNEAHEESRLCTIEVGDQGGTELTGAHITDNGDGTLTAEGTLGNIAVERHGLCLLDGKGTSDTGQFHLDADVTAENAGKEAVEISLSEFEHVTHEEETEE